MNKLPTAASDDAGREDSTSRVLGWTPGNPHDAIIAAAHSLVRKGWTESDIAHD